MQRLVITIKAPDYAGILAALDDAQLRIDRADFTKRVEKPDRRPGEVGILRMNGRTSYGRDPLATTRTQIADYTAELSEERP